MGEFIVKKFDTYLLMKFEVDALYTEHDFEDKFDRIAQLAYELQRLNGWKTVIVQVGDKAALIISGLNTTIDVDKLGEVLLDVKA